MRVVLDTNIIVSMALAKGGTMQALRQSWREGRFTVLGSSELLEEVAEVLEYPRLSALLTPEAKKTTLNELTSLAETVVLSEPYPMFAEDKDDSYLLAMVRDGEADCLVTGDKPLLELGRFEGIPIINAAQFLTLLEEANA
jgi:uncharacterized protein